MRLDKFLKLSRLVKRRTLAKEICDQGRVTVNGKVAKAGTSVSVGDQLSIRFGHKKVTVCIEKLQETVKKEESASLYTVLKEERVQDEESESLSSNF